MDTPFDYEHEHRCAEHEHGLGLSSMPISTAQIGQLLFERALRPKLSPNAYYWASFVMVGPN